ncbi:MAG TPA: DUF58 domain-containing protein [Acidimicrobiales bacterium]
MAAVTSDPQATLPLGARLLSRLDRARRAMGRGSLRRLGASLERRLGLTRSGQLAIVAGVLAWIAGRMVAGPSMYMPGYGAILLTIAAVFMAPRNLKLAGVRDGLYPRVQEGDRLDVQLTLTAGKRLSTFMLEERLPDRLGRTVRVPVTSMSSGADLVHPYTLRANRRGVYQVGPLVAVAGDSLGLAQRETVIAEPFELFVHPRIEPVVDRPLTRHFEDPPIRPPVSKPWPSGMEFYGMREYVRGDDPRRIVWRASARTGTLMVRENEQGITDKITIILDTNRTYHSRDADGVSASFETGVRAAASLAVRHLREGYEIKVVTNEGFATRPLRGEREQQPMLDAFARVDMGRTPLGQAIMQLLATGQRDAHNILVTPHLGPHEAANLKLLLRTGVSVLVIALIWDEENTDVLGTAASLGCQVVGIHPDQDIGSALSADARGGRR